MPTHWGRGLSWEFTLDYGKWQGKWDAVIGYFMYIIFTCKLDSVVLWKYKPSSKNIESSHLIVVLSVNTGDRGRHEYSKSTHETDWKSAKNKYSF